MYNKVVKRAIDFIIALLVFIIFWWVYVILIIAIKADSPGPAIFKQERIGLNGEVFILRKFRSMCLNAEHTGSGVYSGDDDPRVTKVGRFIRKTSLDELPQLINLLKGDMSLIGPRPPLTYHPWPIEEYTKEQLRMFEVRPGMSGWAQVHGRKEVEWNERIKLNVWYVDHISFALDVKILFKTIYTIIFKKDNANTEATVKSDKNQNANIEATKTIVNSDKNQNANTEATVKTDTKQNQNASTEAIVKTDARKADNSES